MARKQAKQHHCQVLMDVEIDDIEALFEAAKALHEQEYPGQRVTRADWSVNGKLSGSLLMGWWLNFHPVAGGGMVNFKEGMDSPRQAVALERSMRVAKFMRSLKASARKRKVYRVNRS